MEYGGAASVQKNNNNSSATATAFGSLAESSSAAELGDFIDELLVEGCWLETTAGSGSYNMMHPSSSSSVSCGESNTNTTAFAQLQPQPQYYLPTNNSSSSCSDDQIMMLQQDPSSSEESFVVGKRWWIGPKGGPGGPPSSVKERLVVAVGYLKEYYTSSKIISNNNTTNNVLFQVWVPPCRSSPTGSGLHFHNHISSINDFHFHEAVSFPTLTPKANPPDNVRFFRSHDYPRLLQYDARGSFALPVFERGTGACLGVLDILIANHQSHMFNYRPQLLDNNVCNALEAVDFRSCQNLIIQPPAINKVFEELYQAALNEIVEVMTSVCKTHNLPLALTWAPCIQQGKCCGGCVSTLDSACFVGDLDILGFQEACSECHLLRDQGIVGTSLTTTKPCFAMDITAFSKAEYPLAHHAIVFGLHAAVAIPLRSVYTGSAADFVLEFFLPKECQDSEEQKHLLNSLSMVVQQACRSLHVATTTTDLLLDNDDFTLPSLTTAAADHDHKLQQLFAAQMQAEEEAAAACVKEQSSSTTSWIAHMMEAQEQQNKKGKGVCVSMEYHQLEEPKEEFKVTTNWDTTTNQGHLHFSSDFGHIDHTSASASLGSGSRASADGGLDQQDSYVAASFGGRRSSSASSGGRKSSDKRRTKAEKTISLPVLRQYFAGSLKDAAKSIGVCPTTLKRICRQHGITRWPSRKIKKVGHSLKKLQLVIDSVQGAEGAIQIGSFYASFPELSSADFSSSSSPATTARSNQPSKKAAPNTLKSIAAAASASCSSQTNATFGAGNHHHQAFNSTALMMMTESCDAAAELQQHASSSMLIQEEEEEETKHFTWNSLRDRDRGGGVFRVKATFVDEKIRFSLQQNWGFRELQEEIARRFNLNDISNMDLKYLDEDGEWVLLACDADLHECQDIHTSSQARTIRLSLFHPNTSFATTSTNNTPERT